MKVRLVNIAGAFVTSAEIPPFNIYPDIIFWGTRTFRLNDAGRLLPANQLDEAQYVEAFAYSLVGEKVEVAKKGKKGK